jgi:hypothetical protein
LKECKWLPAAADWERVRPKPYQQPIPQAQSLDKNFGNLAAKASDPWNRFIALETAKGLKLRDMVAAYDRIIAEGERRKLDVDGFRGAKQKCLDIREARGRK